MHCKLVKHTYNSNTVHVYFWKQFLVYSYSTLKSPNIHKINEFSTLISIHFLRELAERILLRDQSIFSLVNILLILIGFSLDDELILLVDVVDVGQSRHSKG